MIGSFPSKVILGLSIAGVIFGIGCPRALAQQAGNNGQLSELSLDGCIQLGLANQPAVSAAQSSLDAAEWAAHGLRNLPRVAGLLSHDLPYRRQQACLGVTIAQAALDQAEWETRYAITRNFFSVVYARDQVKVVSDVIIKLTNARTQVKKLIDNDDVKTTMNDLRNLDIQIALIRLRLTDATVGIDRANAALREAIGVGREYQFVVPKNARLPDPVSDLDLDGLVAMGLDRRGEM
ncbi:MAG TPA: hypothetical protein VKE98_07410, partial [Gemmataceae bacterium]|nr:hypothetical protein [Gemmataceae bacterium]